MGGVYQGPGRAPNHSTSLTCGYSTPACGQDTGGLSPRLPTASLLTCVTRGTERGLPQRPPSRTTVTQPIHLLILPAAAASLRLALTAPDFTLLAGLADPMPPRSTPTATCAQNGHNTQFGAGAQV